MSGAKAVVVKWIGSSPQRVYAACTDPELLALWLDPKPFVATDVEADVRIGGRFWFRIKGEPGVYAAEGRYLELAPPQRIVLSWVWVESPDPPPNNEPGERSTVTFDIEPHDGGTTVTLTHEGLADEDAAAGHQQGWGEALDKLAALFPADGFAQNGGRPDRASDR